MSGLTGRVVVAAHSSDGKARFVSDDHVPPTDLAAGGVTARLLWGRDEAPNFPDNGRAQAQALMPPPGGLRLSTLTIPSGANGPYHDFIAKNLGAFAEPEAPGFHRTPSLDVIVVIEGEIVLELDAGDRQTLGRGDTAILNGVRHRWSNNHRTDATLLAVVIGAQDRRS
ncbi:MAG: cupin domain-containing protein [Hyphomonadaceae bacterium]|nr:cupin domain-containing protein [Hyphomonadaceae bacterium]